MNKEKLILRSYSNLKNIKTKIYKIGNIPILAPIEIDALAIFSVSLIVVLIINGIIEIPLNPMYKFIGIPVGITAIIKTTRIEGKPPHLYFWRLIQYQQIRKKPIENFEVKEVIEEIKFK